MAASPRTKIALSVGEHVDIAEAIYDAYRLGKYGSGEHLPMWHELDVDTRNRWCNSPETLRAVEAAQRATTRVAANARRSERARMERLREGSRAR